jgi:hypothetical protein
MRTVFLLNSLSSRLHAWLSCIMQQVTGRVCHAAVFLYPIFGLRLLH